MPDPAAERDPVEILADEFVARLRLGAASIPGEKPPKRFLSR